METAKQKAIREAYGNDFKLFKPDENGWSEKMISYTDIDWEKFETDDCLGGYYSVRPKSLKGIEDNNGWFLIEDLDVDYDEYVLFLRMTEGGEPPILTSVLSDDFQKDYFTHWKRIDLSKPPIY